MPDEDRRGTRGVARSLVFLRGVFGLDERRCAACHAPFTPDTPRDVALCPRCRSRLMRYTAARCPLCGLPSPTVEASSLPCGRCLVEPPPWDVLIFHGLYADLLQALLLRLKFGGDFPAARVLGKLLAEDCAELPPVDAVVPLPQHSARLRGRGFNQALELARIVAVTLRTPLTPGLLSRTSNPPPQEHLTARQRRENPKGSFAAHDVRNARIVIVDDTMTTGSTLRHAALTLKEHGAKTVCVAVVARTPAPGHAAPAARQEKT